MSHRTTKRFALAVSIACLLASVPSIADESAGNGPGERASSSTGPPASACDDARARAVAEVVQRRYDAIDDLSADFVQTTESVVLGMGALPGEDDAGSVSRGRVLFAKPGRMHWSYREPEESHVISNGRVLWIYDVAARQVTRMPVGEEALAGAALQFLLGEGRLDETFRIAAIACAQDAVELDLEPVEPASYERLGLIADPETGLIASTSIVDLFGNRTRIRFEGLKANTGPPVAAFEFTVPDGVDLIDMAQPR